MLEKQLNDLSIYALRELARRTGVVSPTSKKKHELIREILAIKSGEKQPQLAKTRQGRPPKGSTYLQSFEDEYKLQNSSNIIKFNQNETRFVTDESTTISGYVELLDAGSSILWANKGTTYTAYFIPNNILNENNLKMGDFLVAVADSSLDQRVLKDVLSINGCPITKFENKRKNYFEINHVEPTKNVEFAESFLNDLNIKLGESVYFYGVNNNNNTKVVSSLLNSAKVDDKIYINVSLADKNKMYLNNLKAEMFVANFTDEQEKTKRVVSLAVERTKRSLETGKNVIVVVDDVLSVSGVDNEELTIVKNLMSLTKCSKKGSVTLFAVMSTNAKFSMFEKLADKRFKIEADQIIKID